MRPIDADSFKESINKARTDLSAEGDTDITDIVCKAINRAIDAQPKIAAIPIEWLRKQQAVYHDGYLNKIPEVIEFLLAEWENENESKSS